MGCCSQGFVCLGGERSANLSSNRPGPSLSNAPERGKLGVLRDAVCSCFFSTQIRGWQTFAGSGVATDRPLA
jgi:hypothetical protein